MHVLLLAGVVHTRSRSVTSCTGVSLETIDAKSWMSAKSTDTAGSVSATMVPVCVGLQLEYIRLQAGNIGSQAGCIRAAAWGYSLGNQDHDLERTG